MLKGNSQPSLPRPTEGQLFSPDEVDQTEKEVGEARPLFAQPPFGKEPHRNGAG